MNDGFSFGEPAKRPSRSRDVAAPRGRRSSVPVTVFVGGALIVAAGAAFVVLRSASVAGDRLAAIRSETVVAIDRANDAAARATLGRAIVVARTAWAEAGSFPTDPTALMAFDPSVRFTAGASTGPDLVATSTDASTFAAAVRSRSGACWWVKLDAAGVTTYGSGGTCTGQAAEAADAASW